MEVPGIEPANSWLVVNYADLYTNEAVPSLPKDGLIKVMGITGNFLICEDSNGVNFQIFVIQLRKTQLLLPPLEL